MPSPFQTSLITRTGAGSIFINTLVNNVFTPPPDGMLVLRFRVYHEVTAWDSSVIWTQITANRTQLRGGRYLFAWDGKVTYETYVNRLQWVSPPLISMISDPNNTSQDNVVGTGTTEVIVDVGINQGIPCSQIDYGLEPSVTCGFRVKGIVETYWNHDDAYQLIPTPL